MLRKGQNGLHNCQSCNLKGPGFTVSTEWPAGYQNGELKVDAVSRNQPSPIDSLGLEFGKAVCRYRKSQPALSDQ